jgi:hypothetical protein
VSGPHVRVPASTCWVTHGGVVYAARLPDGPPLVLAGPGALVWDAVVAAGALDLVVDQVAAATGESAAHVRPGVVAFVDGLVDAGVLELSTAADDG